MAMTPNAGEFILRDFSLSVQPSATYRLDLARDRISGMTDEKEALLQAIYLILSTERYAYVIYSRRYGIEMDDVIGQDRDYAISELRRRITDALEADDRITGVGEWSFEETRKTVTASFTVHTIYGDIAVTKEADI